MLDAFIIEKIRRERRSEERDVRVPLQPPTPLPPERPEEKPPPRRDDGGADIDFRL